MRWSDEELRELQKHSGVMEVMMMLGSSGIHSLIEECLAARKILPALSSSAGWCKSATCENEDCVALRGYLRWVRG